MKTMEAKTIVCVTPNVALDRTLVVPDFAIGHISRIDRAIAVPGGKGLNVLRAARILGGQVLAMGLLGGYSGRMIAAMTAADGYAAEWTFFEGETRTCTIIASPGGNSTVINESGCIAPADWLALAEDICAVAARPDVAAICLCGSLPQGAPAGAPANLIGRIKDLGQRVWVDSSKQYLKNAIDALPFAIKVNREEIAAAMGIDAGSRPQVIAAAKSLIARGIRLVVISMGAQGALLFSEKLMAEAIPPPIQALDPVASGDCLHAGLVTALIQGADYGEALRCGVAAGTVNALYAGGAQFPYAHYQEILARTELKIVSY